MKDTQRSLTYLIRSLSAQLKLIECIDVDVTQLKFYDLVTFKHNLDKRYLECDEKGNHIKPDLNKDICGYCYRNLTGLVGNYNNKLYEERKGIPINKLPCDGPELMKERRRLSKEQERLDLARGLVLISKEL